MTYMDCDLVAEHSEAKGKAKFLLYVIARHIGPVIKNGGGGNNYFPGYAYIGKKRMARSLSSWPKEVDQWLVDLAIECIHTSSGENWAAKKNGGEQCKCEGQGLGEVWILPGIDPSGQGALYCLSLRGDPDVHDGCPHGGKCLHGTEKAWQEKDWPEDDEYRWYCPHSHLADESCPHEMDSRKRCICRSSQESHN